MSIEGSFEGVQNIQVFNLDSKLMQVIIIWKFVQVLCYTAATILKVVESVKSFLKQKHQIFAHSM